jgi:signal transduction histidine kinase
MKQLLNLKQSVILSIVFVIVSLVAGYSLLAGTYFIAGMDNIVASNIVQAARHKIDFENTVDPLKTLRVTKSWEEQPEAIKKAFPVVPHQIDKLYKYRSKADRSLLFVLKQEIAGDVWFISFRLTNKNMVRLVRNNARQSLYALRYIALATVLVVGLIVWWAFRRISRPITGINQWAKNLNEHNLDKPIPDFVYPELNDFAKLVHQSLLSAKAGLEREEQLLRQTSHELRTPISVIRNNVELAKKIQLKSHSQEVDERILDRIDRASLTMKQMTETLLWLNKEELTMLSKQTVRLDTLVNEVIEQLAYLLQGKKVNLNVSLEPVTLALPEAATCIVIGNLIRNAFQHTQEGDVDVLLTGSMLTITNRESIPGDTQTDLGFGLGLKLTEQLTKKLGWPCIFQTEKGLYRVVLTLS